MRHVLSLALILVAAFSSVVMAEDNTNRAKASLVLAKVKRARMHTQPQSCDAQCELAKAALAKCKLDRSGCIDDIARAEAVAKTAGKTLFYWVGMNCDEKLRTEFPDAVHCHAGPALWGDSTPRLVVGPDPKGLHYRFEPSQFDGAGQTIRGLMSPAKQPVISPTTMPIWGGFVGDGGGCANGQCGVPQSRFRR